MTEIDYTLLEGIATPVAVYEDSIHLHRQDGCVGIMKTSIIDIKDEAVTVDIRTNKGKVSVWKNVNYFHVTLL